MSELGKLRKPYPLQNCAADDCRAALDEEAYLHKNLDDGKLYVFCGDCSRFCELNQPHRLPLVAL